MIASSLREASLEVIKNLPEDTSLEQIMYEIRLASQVLEGLKDVKEGKTINTEDLLAEIENWKKDYNGPIGQKGA